MTTKFGSIVEKFRELSSGYVDIDETKPIVVNPAYRLYVSVALDPDYLLYMNRLIGQIPGTETLKINCAFSSLFVLGFATTKAYRKETQEKQPLRYEKYIGDRMTPLGRNLDEIFAYIYTHFLVGKTPSGKVVRAPPVDKFRYSLPRIIFRNPDKHKTFVHDVLTYLKSYIPTTKTLRFDAATAAKSLAASAAAGSARKGGHKVDHIVPAPHATMLLYGTVDGQNAHFVTLIHIDKLYMIDYQQQYIVAEEDILNTIVQQCSTGRFKVRNIAKGGVEDEVEGFGYIKSATEETIPSLFLSLVLTADPAAEPLYEGAAETSIGITKRMNLFQSIRQGRSEEIVQSELVGELKRWAAGGISAGTFEVQKGESFTKRTPKLLDRIRNTLTVADKTAIVQQSFKELFDRDDFAVEPTFMPDVRFPEELIRSTAELRARHIADPAEKSAYIEEILATDRKKSGAQVSMDMDLDFLAIEFYRYIDERLTMYLGMGGGGAMNLSV